MKCYSASFEDGRGPGTNEHRQLLEAEKGKKQIVPESFHKKHSPADTWILAHRDPFQTSDHRNCKM